MHAGISPQHESLNPNPQPLTPGAQAGTCIPLASIATTCHNNTGVLRSSRGATHEGLRQHAAAKRCRGTSGGARS